MYLDDQKSQAKAPLGIQANSFMSTDAAAPPSGVASRVGALQETVHNTLGLVANLCTALGIQRPNEASKVPDSTLADVLLALRIKLSSANDDIQAAIQHLNS